MNEQLYQARRRCAPPFLRYLQKTWGGGGNQPPPGCARVKIVGHTIRHESRKAREASQVCGLQFGDSSSGHRGAVRHLHGLLLCNVPAEKKRKTIVNRTDKIMNTWAAHTKTTTRNTHLKTGQGENVVTIPFSLHFPVPACTYLITNHLFCLNNTDHFPELKTAESYMNEMLPPCKVVGTILGSKWLHRCVNANNFFLYFFFWGGGGFRPHLKNSLYLH